MHPRVSRKVIESSWWCIALLASEIVILYNNQPLTDDKKGLNSYGLKDGDLVSFQHLSAVPSRMSSGGKSIIIIGQKDEALTFPFSSTRTLWNGLQRHSSASVWTVYSKPCSASLRWISWWSGYDQGHAARQSRPARPSSTEQSRSGRGYAEWIIGYFKMLDIFHMSCWRIVLFIDSFATVLRRQFAEKQQAEQQKMKLFSASPFDSEAQRLIAEEIRRKNIEANMEAAIEYNPETFGTVIMLYINCKVNGYPVKAFIDSGAQATIMSSAAAERCNIMRLVDVRWAGIAKGVGVQRIIGRIHMVQIQIENDFLTSSFSVLEQQPMDMLLGLDMLKRHQCSIDLKNNMLVIGTTGTTTKFLTESELPDCARLTGSPEEEKRALEESSRIAEELEMKAALEKSAKESGGAGPSTSMTSPSNDNRTRVLPSDKFTEADVADLMKNGFQRLSVIEELRKFNGDKTQALAALFAKSFVF